MNTMDKGNTGKKDLRIQKTQKALYTVLLAKLGSRNFNDITVNDLCAEASVSRATFYTHFNDKYDLLKYLLAEIREDIVKDVYKYDELEHEINSFIENNKKLITNVFRDANNETLMYIREFTSSIVEMMIKREVDNEICSHHIILLNFFTGGLVRLLAWMVENNFPPEINLMNAYLYKMMETVMIWDAEQAENIPGA